MKTYKTPDISLFFGDKICSFDEVEVRTLPGSVLDHPPFRALAGEMDQLLFFEQVHGAQGYVIDSYAQAQKSFDRDGDYLVTRLPRLGLGMASADCLPILYYDPVQGVVAAAHAGWRSSVAGVAQRVVAQMSDRFGSQPQDIRVWFGPCAHVCCYEVSPDFIDQFKEEPFFDQVVCQRDGRWFFDVPMYNRIQLKRAGISDEHCDTTYSQCTICNPQFCSYRRERGSGLRQMSVIVLNA